MPLLMLKTTVFLSSLAPLLWYLYAAWSDNLGANPIEAATRGLGTWALNFLLITLAVTPLIKLSGWRWPIHLRRMLGLFCYFYAVLHLTSYLWLDKFFFWDEIWQDILKRPYITVGMLALVLLTPLAATSNNFSIRRLGGPMWAKLHRLVYLIAILALTHYFLLVKFDITTPLAYAAVLTALLGIRLYWRQRRLRRVRGAANGEARSPLKVLSIPLRLIPGLARR